VLWDPSISYHLGPIPEVTNLASRLLQSWLFHKEV